MSEIEAIEEAAGRAIEKLERELEDAEEAARVIHTEHGRACEAWAVERDQLRAENARLVARLLDIENPEGDEEYTNEVERLNAELSAAVGENAKLAQRVEAWSLSAWKYREAARYCGDQDQINEDLNHADDAYSEAEQLDREGGES